MAKGGAVIEGAKSERRRLDPQAQGQRPLQRSHHRRRRDNRRKKRVAVYGKTRSEVAEKLAKMIVNPVVEPGKLTVEEWLTEWLEVYAKPGIRNTTYESYEIMVRVHLIPALGKFTLKSLTVPQIQRLYIQKQKDKSSRTVHYIHTVLSMALNKAEELGYINKNICRSVTPPRQIKHQIQPLSQNEFKTLL